MQMVLPPDSHDCPRCRHRALLTARQFADELEAAGVDFDVIEKLTLKLFPTILTEGKTIQERTAERRKLQVKTLTDAGIDEKIAEAFVLAAVLLKNV